MRSELNVFPLIRAMVLEMMLDPGMRVRYFTRHQKLKQKGLIMLRANQFSLFQGFSTVSRFIKDNSCSLLLSTLSMLPSVLACDGKEHHEEGILVPMLGAVGLMCCCFLLGARDQQEKAVSVSYSVGDATRAKESRSSIPSNSR